MMMTVTPCSSSRRAEAARSRPIAVGATAASSSASSPTASAVPCLRDQPSAGRLRCRHSPRRGSRASAPGGARPSPAQSPSASFPPRRRRNCRRRSPAPAAGSAAAWFIRHADALAPDLGDRPERQSRRARTRPPPERRRRRHGLAGSRRTLGARLRRTRRGPAATPSSSGRGRRGTATGPRAAPATDWSRASASPISAPAPSASRRASTTRHARGQLVKRAIDVGEILDVGAVQDRRAESRPARSGSGRRDRPAIRRRRPPARCR